MADNQKIGTAYLEVVPKVDPNFSDDLAKQGEKGGDKFGTGFAGKMKGAISAGLVFVGNLLANMATQALNALGQFVGDSIQTGMNFDAAMSQVAATMGTTVDKIQDLQEFAQEMGRTTAFSANQAAEALNYMALAGYTSEEAMQALPNVLNLAAAGSIDLARASDMVTDAQSALGLKFEELDGFVDQLAKTASTTNTSVEQLGDAVLTVGGTAKMMAGGTEELNQVLGLLADNGIKGAEGGTALRNILLSLASPTDAASKTLQALGVSVFDAEGNMRSMQDVMGDLNAAMADMTSEERTNAISSIFNKRDLKSVEALLGTQAERWDEVGAAIENAKGAAQAMADTQLDNLAGDVTLFQSALEGLQIELFHYVEPALRGFVGAATDGLGQITAALPGLLSDLHAYFFGVEAEYDEFGNVVVAESDGIFSSMSGVFEDVMAIVEKVWPTIQSVITGVLNALVKAFEAAWPFISGLVTTAMEAIRVIVDNVWPYVDFIITSVISDVTSVIQGLSPLVSFVSGIFDGIKAAMTDPVETAKTTIGWLIDTIRGFFSFEISWPHIPLPRFAVTPANWGISDLLRGIIPSIGIEWYAKGGIVDSPTLIGAGEAGTEAIIPLSGNYMLPFARAIAAEMGGGGNYITVNLDYSAGEDAMTLAQDLARELGNLLGMEG